MLQLAMFATFFAISLLGVPYVVAVLLATVVPAASSATAPEVQPAHAADAPAATTAPDPSRGGIARVGRVAQTWVRGRVVTPAGVVDDGLVVVSGGRVEYVGRAGELPAVAGPGREPGGDPGRAQGGRLLDGRLRFVIRAATPDRVQPGL